MAKKAVKKQQNIQQRITVYFGYGLFSLVVGSLIISLVPFGAYLTNPNVLHFNIIATMIAFALAAVLPALAGYFVGDTVTRGKSKLIHHYNGVLFGILGYWVSVILMAFGAFIDLSDISVELSISAHLLGSILPAVIAVVILVFCGVFYARHTQHRTTVLNYKPYRVLFICCVFSLFVLSSLSIAISSWFGATIVSSLAALLLPVVMVAVLALFGAWLIGPKNGTWTTRFLKSLIAFSYGAIAMNTSIQLLWFNPALASWSIVFGIAVWVVYIYVLRRYPNSEK